MNMKYLITLFLTAFITAGCSTSVNIKTNPEGADVTVSSGDKFVLLGKSPLTVKEKKIAEKLGVSLSSINYYKLTASRNGEVSETVLVPIGSWGRRSTTIVIPMDNTSTAAAPDRVLRHIVNAQKFAESKQLLKSHGELDEALKLSPKFSYAMSMKGALYYADKDFQRSKEWYTKALNADPGNTEALMMLQDLKNK